MKSYFIITIDTEGDNLWKVGNSKKETERITNKNGEYIGRFQELCEKYNFIPTYLINHEMTQSVPFIEMARQKVREEKMEAGMHLHAFNSPPYYELGDYSGGNKSYAGEYPKKILYQKIDYLTKMLQDTFQTSITSHRGGRWYFDEAYMAMLKRQGYMVDCSVTPHINWYKNRGQTKASHGIDYRKFHENTYQMSKHNLMEQGKGLWQVPVSIINKPFQIKKEGIKNIKKVLFPDKIWLRPDIGNLKDMLYLVERKVEEKSDYIEFMLHSSELMPGGSPIFPKKSDIEKLYRDLDILFKIISNNFEGSGLTNYILRKGRSEA